MKNIHDHLNARKPPLRDAGHIISWPETPVQMIYSISINYKEFGISPSLFEELTTRDWNNIKETATQRLEQ